MRIRAAAKQFQWCFRVYGFRNSPKLDSQLRCWRFRY